MIVLDEQLLGRSLKSEISAWYRGSVRFIHELRPQTVVKDEAVPTLLRTQRQPTFVTINERDFWRKIEPDSRFCIVCFAFSDSEATKIPPILKRLFRHPEFRQKVQRMGRVIRYSSASLSYYTRNDRTVRSIIL